MAIIQNFDYVKCGYLEMPKIKHDIMCSSNKKLLCKW